MNEIMAHDMHDEFTRSNERQPAFLHVLIIMNEKALNIKWETAEGFEKFNVKKMNERAR
jgi:hypothetical protein